MDYSRLLQFIADYWAVFVAISATAMGITEWILKRQQIKKLRLEIAVLQSNAKKNKASPIEIATLDEIAKYANTIDNPRSIKKFIQSKINQIQHESGNEEFKRSSSIEAVIALADRGNSISTLEILRLATYVALSFLLSRFLEPLIEWLTTSESSIAKGIRITLEAGVFLVLSALMIGLVYQILVWVNDRSNQDK